MSDGRVVPCCPQPLFLWGVNELWPADRESVVGSLCRGMELSCRHVELRSLQGALEDPHNCCRGGLLRAISAGRRRTGAVAPCAPRREPSTPRGDWFPCCVAAFPGYGLPGFALRSFKKGSAAETLRVHKPTSVEQRLVVRVTEKLWENRNRDKNKMRPVRMVPEREPSSSGEGSLAHALISPDGGTCRYRQAP